jgi:DNA mismatch endonuclease (patch repair protein)
LAVFVDGAFWHGHPDYYWGQSGPFWDEKISRNRTRDEEVTATLESDGWSVIRLWDFEIDKDLDQSVSRIRDVLAERLRASRRIDEMGTGSPPPGPLKHLLEL